MTVSFARLGIVAIVAAALAVIGLHLVQSSPTSTTRATTCFTVTVTNTPLQPAPGATLCLPIDLPSS